MFDSFWESCQDFYKGLVEGLPKKILKNRCTLTGGRKTIILTLFNDISVVWNNISQHCLAQRIQIPLDVEVCFSNERSDVRSDRTRVGISY